MSLTRDAHSMRVITTLMEDLARDARTLHLYARKIIKGRNRLLVVVDQFEELFTLCREEVERQAFVDNLLTAISPEREGPTIVVIALRADFYAHCAHYAALRQAIAKQQEYIGPMSAEELRRAMEGPVQRGSWEIEPGLVDLILREIGDEPGALPLLSHALLETWQRRRGRTLTFAGYTASGGVRGAIARTAEMVYQKFSTEQQAIARNIFLRLTELGEGTQDTRRRASLSELIPPYVDARAAEVVLKTLADARLITTGEDYAEVAHEALIREWPTLHEWLSQDREGLRLHRHLTEAAQAWQKLNRDEGELYRSARLAQALEWAETHFDESNPSEREFLDASKELLEREEAERKAQQRRELIAAQRLAETQTRAAGQLRKRAVFLAGALFIAAVLAIAAFVFAQRAEEERRVAFVRELSASSVNNLNVDPERSILLALQAVSASSSGGKPVLREAEEALHRAVTTSRIQLTLRGHTTAVWDVTFSPDGKRLATASSDQTAKVWDAASGKELLTLAGHTNPVRSVAFNPDGTRLATASTDKTAIVWDISTALNTGATTGQRLLTLRGHTDAITAVAYSPDGKRLITAGGNTASVPSVDHTVKVWDAATGQLLLTFTGHTQNVRGIAFSPDGRRVASASEDGTAKVWDSTTGEVFLTISGHNGTVYDAVFSADGRRLATPSLDQTTKVWDATSGQLMLTLVGHASSVWGVNFNRAGTRLVTSSLDGTAKVWDLATGQLLFTLAGHTAGIRDLSLSPDGTRVATASDDNTVKVWDISPSGSREWLTLAGHTSMIYGLAISPDGTRLVTASSDKTAKVWDISTALNPSTGSGQGTGVATSKELLTFTGHSDQIRRVAFSPDGRRIATTSWDETAKVWDAKTGEVLLTLPTQATPSVSGGGVAFGPDGQRLATASAGNTAKIWDAITGKELVTLTGHTGRVNRLSFSPDGRRLATAADVPDRTVKVWDTVTGEELLTLRGHNSGVYNVAFSPDGTRLATASQDGTARVWDASTGQALLTLSGHTTQVNEVAFSPDGTHLATASSDGTAKVWHIATTGSRIEQPLTLYGHTAGVQTVAFSPDGRRLVTGSFDGTARVWALPLEDIVAIAQSRVTRTLTTDECQKFLHTEQCPPDPRLDSSALPRTDP